MTEQFLAPAMRPEEDELERSLRPRKLDEFVGQERVKEQLDIALQAARGARGAARPRPARRAAWARQDEPRLHRPGGARRGNPLRRRPRARAEGRHGGDPDGPRAAGRPLHRRDPPAVERRRRGAVPGARGLPARHHRRPGPRRPHADARGAAVHARRRDDAHGAAHDAAPRPLRDDVPARVLRGLRARRHRPPLRRDPRRRARG